MRKTVHAKHAEDIMNIPYPLTFAALLMSPVRFQPAWMQAASRKEGQPEKKKKEEGRKSVNIVCCNHRYARSLSN